MPIVLGDTTISGLAVGGLPAGTVNSTTLADSSVTRTKLGVAGVPFNAKLFLNNTRTGLSIVNNQDMWTVTYNKLSSTSIIYARAELYFRDPYNGEVGFYIRYGSSSQQFLGCSYINQWGGSATSETSIKQFLQSSITGYTTTGSQTFAIGWNSANNTGNMPSPVWNPTAASDGDARRRDGGSSLLIWEMEP